MTKRVPKSKKNNKTKVAGRLRAGFKGHITKYISRSKAISKLQITLKDFRRLCILKGIFPREPPASANANKNRTYYHVKDISFLQHEPLLEKLREQKIFLRRYRKKLAKKELYDAKLLNQRKPTFEVDHLVKERYPTFEDALRDFDDALCTLFLFRLLRSGINKHYTTEMSYITEQLCSEWENFMIQTGAVKKVFVSLRGYYYQAVIKGIQLTWLVPHKGTYTVPTQVDVRTMLTFLHFYQTMARFINYKLYADNKISYPYIKTEFEYEKDVCNFFKVKFVPVGSDERIVFTKNAKEYRNNEVFENTEANDLKKKIKTVGGIDISYALLQAQKIQKKAYNKNTISSNINEDDDDDGIVREDDKIVDDLKKFNELDSNNTIIRSDDNSKIMNLFKDKVFLINREVPIENIRFLLKMCGAIVLYEPYVSEEQKKSELIHYQVVDRPNINNIIASRIYVQPQYVFDCFNECFVLPTAPYAPGVKLPPHLSPFTNDEGIGYIPEQRNILRAWVGLPPLQPREVQREFDHVRDEEEEKNMIEMKEEEEHIAGIKKEMNIKDKKRKHDSIEDNNNDKNNKKIKNDNKSINNKNKKEEEIEDEEDMEFDEDDYEEDEDIEIIGGDTSEEEVSEYESSTDDEDDEEADEDDEDEVEQIMLKNKKVIPQPKQAGGKHKRDNDVDLAKMTLSSSKRFIAKKLDKKAENKGKRVANLEFKRDMIKKGEKPSTIPHPRKHWTLEY